jgi:hypothetical protein
MLEMNNFGEAVNIFTQDKVQALLTTYPKMEGSPRQ